LYTNEAAWRLLDKRQAQTPGQARDVLRGPQPAGSSRNPTDFVKPWIELITKSDEAHLSDRAKRALKSMRYYGNPFEDQNLSVDLSNARKPDSGDRASAVWIIKYMQDNNYKSTLALKNAISDKWNAIYKAKQPVAKSNESAFNENFADGKNPGRKGLAKRMGVNTKASVSSLRKTAKHSSGEKQRMSHWLANMKAGRAKNK
jgi:hypothetical protein